MADEGTTIKTFDPTPEGTVQIRRAFQLLHQLVPPSTFNAGRAPVNGTGGDDITKGWKVGSWWFATTGNAETQGIYRCFKNDEDDPEWHKMVDVLLTATAGEPGGGATPDPVVDNQLTRFDSTAGRIQGSVAYLDDNGDVTGVRNHDDVVFIAQASAFSI